MGHTADLRNAPLMTRSIEAVRDKVSAYVERMNYAGKPVQAITLFPGDYDTCITTINRQRRKGRSKDEPKPEPVTHLTWGGGAGKAGRCQRVEGLSR